MTDLHMGPPMGRPARIDPADRAQLAESPVGFSRVAALFRPYGRQLTLVIVMIVATSVVSLAQPFLVREVIDVAIPGQRVGLLVTLVAAMIGIAAAVQLIGVLQTWISSSVGQHVMHDLRTSVFNHLQKQSLGFFTRTRGGEVQSRLVNDVAGMQSVVTTTATSIASNATTAVATTIAMVALSPRLSLLSLVVLPPAIWLTRQVALIRRDITGKLQRTMAEMHGHVEESLSISGVRLSKTLGATGAGAAKFEDISERLIDLELRSQLSGRWRMATMQIIFAAIPAVIYLVAGLPGLGEPMTIGTLIAFTGLQSQIFRPLMGLMNVGSQWVSSMALFSRIFGYLDLRPEVPAPEHPVRIDRSRVEGRVRFEDVGFRYAGADQPTLAGIDLEIAPGSTLALVGETGSGKSTLASLVARLNDPTTGRVTIDGIDVRDLAAADLAALVGVVSQETYLVHDTIRANLLLARPGAPEQELWQALATARIADLVAGLPEGLDTVVGARGFRFSGGEQQRLAIARTILRNPPILVLDEATSALDNETEREVQAGLDRLASGRTTLTIAHRLSTIRDADQIAVLADGRVVEQGTHDELVARGGAYADLLAPALVLPA
ncbi:ATP-binding cassette, subfamily B [Raineyella antarctica]|uniref:ATP-binding cassette, subfamily B n=1 Tax=Raineyella antarctica TaxID=1577474 RepID=A0A1G6GJ90_9ACTN|nr:ABC transporter ATP-binding protein [Raineyella antarctica]SDB81256.1 ATP-binding cassette, subfamily B [Raineyella antarctica]